MTVLLEEYYVLTKGGTNHGYAYFLKEHEFDSIVLRLNGGIAVSLLSWESCQPTTEIRMAPELMDAIAHSWMEYRNAETKETKCKAKSKRNRKKLLSNGVSPKT